MNNTTTENQYCPFWRRLAAIGYDAILLFCVWIVLFLFIPLLESWLPKSLFHAFKLLYLIAISFLYFSWFWKNGGQTPAMRAWRIKLVSSNPDLAITWHHCWLRCMYGFISWGVVGIGFLWAIFDGQNRTWHDRLSNTHIVVLAKNKK